MVWVEGRGMSNRTLLARSVVAYPFVLRDFILNTHIHVYAQTFDKWHNVSFSWQILSRRTHQRELGFHWCLCQISPSMLASDVLNELGRFPYYLYAVMIVKDSVIYILMEKDTLIVCSLIWSSTVVYWEENKGSISGGSLPNHIELD